MHWLVIAKMVMWRVLVHHDDSYDDEGENDERFDVDG